MPPMAASGSHRDSGQPSSKRKGQEQNYAANDKRPRQDHHTLGQGTQHDPLEIESSPEPEARHTPSRQAAGAVPFSASVRDWGLYVDGSARSPNFHAVAGGHVPGIYGDWCHAEEQLRGFKKSENSKGTVNRKFKTLEEAWAYLERQKHSVFEALTRPMGRDYLASVGRPIPSAPQPVQPAHTSPCMPSSPPPAYTRTAQRAPSYAPMHHHTLSGSPSDRWMPSEEDDMISQAENTHLWMPSEENYMFSQDENGPAASSNIAPPAPQNLIASDPEPTLSAEQQRVVDLILQGENVFYTGSAGCGKSTILKAFVRQLQAKGKRIKIVAPTNLAALNVGGQTTWNFAGWTPDSLKKSLKKLKEDAHGKEVWKRFDTTDVLVIDEISMVENHLFERLNEIMKTSRAGKSRGPFGGVQLIVTGDFCQLSPVKPFQYCIGCGWQLKRDNFSRPTKYTCENRGCNEFEFFDIDKWAFRSKAWEECGFQQINLTEIHRQNDKKFISILQRIRLHGTILPNHARVLLNHTSETEGAIRIFSKRVEVDRVNNENIARIPASEIIYKCHDHFDKKDAADISLLKNERKVEDGTLLQLKEHRYEISVNLKEGMRVVLQANLDPAGGLVNGSQGTIIGFDPYDGKKMPRKVERPDDIGPPDAQILRGTHARYQEGRIKSFAKDNNYKPWPIVKFDNGVTKTIYADCTFNELGNEEPYSLLSRTQIPLMAGYACTVHKSQGMTLDRVVVDLAKAFEPSQIYVALSRARSLNGLKVEGLPNVNLGGANPQVREFMESVVAGSK